MSAILLFLYCLANPIGKTTTTNSDTCRVHQIPIDTLFREITWYTDYYDAFRKNDTSEYQLISISVPYDDASGTVLYYRTDNNIGVSEIGMGRDIRREVLSRDESCFLAKELNKIERGGYVCICNLGDMNIVYSVCIAKGREKLCFNIKA